MRPEFQPTEEQRRMVESMARWGVPQEEIAAVLGVDGIDPKTLRKHFREELDRGELAARATLRRTGYEMATSGRHPSMTAFMLRTRCHMREEPRSVWPRSGEAGEQPLPDPPAPVLGKKEQAMLDAQHAGEGSEWGDDLRVDFSRPN